MLKLFGDADSVKLGCGAALTVKDTVVVALKLPDVPLMVIVGGPVVAVLLAESVKVLLPVAGLTLKVGVTPAGGVDVLNVTLPLKPFCAVIAIVLVPLVP